MLPSHIHWSGDPEYDLKNRADRKLVYQQVLAEGQDNDIRYFIDVAALADLWYQMPLPASVREVWGRGCGSAAGSLRRMLDHLSEALAVSGLVVGE